MKINSLGIFIDAQGNKYEILESVVQTVNRPLNGSTNSADGAKGYQTACGIPVNVKNGVFVTWDDLVLTSFD